MYNCYECFKTYSRDELYLSLGQIEYLRSLYKYESYNDILISGDFDIEGDYVLLKTINVPTKIHVDKLFEIGINKCLKRLKKSVISSIKSDHDIVSYIMEKD